MAVFFLPAQAQKKGEIRYNQVGYYTDEEKVVVFDGADPGRQLTVKDAAGNVVLRPKTQRMAVSPWSGKKRYIVDLSELKEPGNYTVSTKNNEVSIKVGSSVLHDVAVASLKLFYLIRSGAPIQARYAGEYAREVAHPDTHVLVHPSAASEGRPAGSVISSPLGWYDAGDYNKYVVNSAFSIGVMLASYEQNKDYFARLDTNIPESGNATPDLLDEMMFNLRWLLTMQDPADGGVYHKLTTPNFEGFIMPADCHQPRYVVAKSVTATYDFAAVMAQSARLLKDSRDYSEFSAQAEAAARLAYEWAKAHPQAFYWQEALSKKFEPAVTTGTYGDMRATDERFWAATELYRLTGEEAFLNDAKEVMPKQYSLPTWGNVASLGTYSWIASGMAEMRQPMLDQLKAYCDKLIEGVPNSSFQAPYGNQKTDFGWGCLAEGCCMGGMAFLYADRFIAPGKYYRYALQNVDYMLGRNATGYCFVTGFGTKSPMFPHHRISAADNIEKPFPGMLVGGPNPGQQDKGSGNLVYPSNHPDESYLDQTESYASNEIAINWNASLVALLCWIDAMKN